MHQVILKRCISTVFLYCVLLKSPSTQWDIISPGKDEDYDYTITAFKDSRLILRPDSASELVCSPTKRRVTTWTIEPRGKNSYVFDSAFHPNFDSLILSYSISIGNTDSALAINLSRLGPSISQVTAATRNVSSSLTLSARHFYYQCLDGRTELANVGFLTQTPQCQM